MTMDVKSAFLYGEARRKIYIELPRGDPHSGSGQVGVLRKALYGTRDAPLIWQAEIKTTLESIGFRRSRLHPSVYVHDVRQMFLVLLAGNFGDGDCNPLP